MEIDIVWGIAFFLIIDDWYILLYPILIPFCFKKFGEKKLGSGVGWAKQKKTKALQKKFGK